MLRVHTYTRVRLSSTILVHFLPESHVYIYFLFFSLSFFCRSPCPVPCSFSFVFVLSSCRFPFDSWTAFFDFIFASLLSLGADSVILLFRLGVTLPPRSLWAWSMRIPLACCLFLRCWLIFIFFFSSLPFSISIWASFVFVLPFSCGYYTVSSVSVSAATRLAYHIYMCVSWYERTLISPFYCLRYTICFSYCVLSSVLFVFLRSEVPVIFRSRVIGACPVTTDCFVAMS